MKDKSLMKAVIRYLLYFVSLILIIWWTYFIELYLISFIILIFEILIILGILSSAVTLKKQEFLLEIDELLSEELYKRITYPFYVQQGYSEQEITVTSGYVLAIWKDNEGKKIRSVSIVKKDYIVDSDFTLVGNERDIRVFSNSYYKGERDICEIVNRKNLWKIYQALKKQADIDR